MGPDISFSIDQVRAVDGPMSCAARSAAAKHVFTLQLMELAGLSVASAVHLEYERCKRVLILVGPGNNGGDGLVAARHLWQFGHQVEASTVDVQRVGKCHAKICLFTSFGCVVEHILRLSTAAVSPQVCYPKRTDKPLFHGLVKQCEAHGIGFVEPEQLPSEPGKLSERADVVVDSLFGFSFKVQGLYIAHNVSSHTTDSAWCVAPARFRRTAASQTCWLR
jgi:NAD(P)H-hydrate repair Nnr-like enzyme with NAD(P)H-hydrate epimerase domain